MVSECNKFETKLWHWLLIGNPELGLPQIDPLKVDKIDVAQDAGPVTIKAAFRNIDLSGLSKAQVYKISGFDDPGKKKLEIQLKTPLASAVGPYRVKGQVLVLPIGGDGIIKLNFSEEMDLRDNMSITIKICCRKLRCQSEIRYEKSRKERKNLHASWKARDDLRYGWVRNCESESSQKSCVTIAWLITVET